MGERPRVALLIESSRAYGRGLLRGIARYVHAHGPWSVFHDERRIGDDAPAWFRRWTGDGIIARIENPKLLTTLQQMGLPCVDLRGLHDTNGIPSIQTDDTAVVRLAIDHLLERGFVHLAYCGFEGVDYSVRRAMFFDQRTRAMGYEPAIYEGPHRPRHGDISAAEAQGLLYEDQIAEWLRSLPKPVGLMACNDIRGEQVINACRDHNISVPDEVAVIGVDNDEILCELCDPTLSSVEPNTERIGFEAAATLDRMMGARVLPKVKHSDFSRPPNKEVVGRSRARSPQSLTRVAVAGPTSQIPPIGVEVRQSTDVLATADAEMIAAVRLIRDRACKGIRVEEVLARLSISRSTLERRFSALLGRSPGEEILRIRVERVKRLLLETNYPLAKITELVGFSRSGYLIAQFKRRVGMTPGQYRKQWNGGKQLASLKPVITRS